MRVQPGGSVRHRSNTCSQRSAKRQPGNSPESAGTWPGITSSSAPRLPVAGSAAKSLREYGCCGARKKESRAATSTICPAYMTATRCAMPATTPRSWVISRIDIPRFACSERRRSSTCAWMVTSSAVVGSSAIEQVGFAGERERDHHPLLHPAGELKRVVVDPARAVGDSDRVEQLDRPGARSGAAEAGMPW